MAVKQYIGARYVPLIIGEWDSATAYDPLSIVTNNGNTYTSKVKVPAGTPLSDTKYWCLTGNFNAQLQYVSNSFANMQKVFDDMQKVFTEIKDQETSNSNSLASHIGNTSNPHHVTKAQIGLSHVADYDQSKAIVSITRNGTTFTATALDGTTTTFTQQGVEVAKKDIVDMIYPVGSIYMSVNNVSPSTLFGGTWVPIQDKFLLASGSNYTNGNTGGSDTHTLNANELPAHTHVIPEHSHSIDPINLYRIQIYKEENATNESPGLYINSEGSYITERGMVPYRAGTVLSSGNEWVHTGPSTTNLSAAKDSGSTGNGQAFSTMPPYLAVNIWKRTA